MRRFCFALDLIDDPQLIEEYEQWHRKENGWPEIKSSIINADVLDMKIYRTGNRLFMIMDVAEGFSFERKASMDAENAKVQEWENLMWKYQQSLPWAKGDGKWVLMDEIFSLN